MFSGHVLLLACLACVANYHQSAAVVFPYVPVFNCFTAGGLYYISYATHIVNSSTAQTACSPGGYRLVLQASTTSACFRQYYNHMTAASGSNITLWIRGPSGMTCYPHASPCPTLSPFICEASDSSAVPGGSSACPAPPTIAHATVSIPSGLQFPADIFYQCNLGYTIVNSNTAQCQKDGTWVNPTKSCDANICPAPYITNGFTAGAAPFFTMSCCTGYKLVGKGAVSCTSSNSTTPVPTCELVSCPQVEQGLANGTVSNNPNTVYSVQHFTCDVGFKLVGSQSTTCQLNGKWSSAPPTCSRIMCNQVLSSPADGTLATGPRTALSILQYSCNEGFMLQGAAYTMCQLDGTWSNASTTCKQTQSQNFSNFAAGGIGLGIGLAIMGIVLLIVVKRMEKARPLPAAPSLAMKDTRKLAASESMMMSNDAYAGRPFHTQPEAETVYEQPGQVKTAHLY
ncbi:E-selectin-like [Sycon ciliatum]|uniref:E-selectin-like n=1 Tax=Sycon ciliatum TaxID=27933 RepID=UPI0031F685D1